MRGQFIAAAAVVLIAGAWDAHSAGGRSDDQIRQAIIRASIANYPGPCACPYNVMRNGAACGGRSAYNRPGGYAPRCYPADVSSAEVKAYRSQSNGQGGW